MLGYVFILTEMTFQTLAEMLTIDHAAGLVGTLLLSERSFWERSVSLRSREVTRAPPLRFVRFPGV